MVLGSWPAPLRSALDGLAATGVWGIRMALEARAGGLVLNDRSTIAADLARENARRNGIAARIANEDLGTLLRSTEADFVDIDPFGTPMPFLAGALRAARPGSGLGITATDTAVLGGTFPDACLRRYGARPLRCDQGSEIGLRILLGACARIAAEHGKSIDPILSFAAAHFFRTLLLVRNSTGDLAIGRVVRTSLGRFEPGEDSSGRAIGPLWLGPLHRAPLVSRLAPSPWTGPEAFRLLATIQGEAGLPAFFLTTDELARRERCSAPKIDRFLDGLRQMGYRAARTHFHPRGVRTDAPYEDVLRAFRERLPSGSRDGSAPAS